MSFSKNLTVLVLSFLSPAITLASNTEEHFNSGLRSYQEGKFAEAKQSFESALEAKPNSPALLYNLGLSEYRLGEVGRALAFWRMAQRANPSDPLVQEALEFAFSKLTRKELPSGGDFFETLRKGFLVEFGIHSILTLVATSFALFSLLLIRWLKARKQSLEADESAPSWNWKLSGAFVLFLFALVVFGLKSFEILQPRGTIVAKQIEVRAVPDSSGTGLFEIFEGLDVILVERRDEWVRIRYPGGRGGWVPSESVLQTSGRLLVN